MKQVNNRQRQVAQQIQTFLANTLLRDVKDPALGMVTITSVEISKDLGYADIYFVVLESDKQQDSIAVLNKAASFLRKQLAGHMTQRTVPRLRFRLDVSEQQARSLDDLLSTLPEEPGDQQGVSDSWE